MPNHRSDFAEAANLYAMLIKKKNTAARFV